MPASSVASAIAPPAHRPPSPDGPCRCRRSTGCSSSGRASRCCASSSVARPARGSQPRPSVPAWPPPMTRAASPPTCVVPDLADRNARRCAVPRKPTLAMRRQPRREALARRPRNHATMNAPDCRRSTVAELYPGVGRAAGQAARRGAHQQGRCGWSRRHDATLEEQSFLPGASRWCSAARWRARGSAQGDP